MAREVLMGYRQQHSLEYKEDQARIIARKNTLEKTSQMVHQTYYTYYKVTSLAIDLGVMAFAKPCQNLKLSLHWTSLISDVACKQ